MILNFWFHIWAMDLHNTTRAVCLIWVIFITDAKVFLIFLCVNFYMIKMERVNKRNRFDWIKIKVLNILDLHWLFYWSSVNAFLFPNGFLFVNVWKFTFDWLVSVFLIYISFLVCLKLVYIFDSVFGGLILSSSIALSEGPYTKLRFVVT